MPRMGKEGILPSLISPFFTQKSAPLSTFFAAGQDRVIYPALPSWFPKKSIEYPQSIIKIRIISPRDTHDPVKFRSDCKVLFIGKFFEGKLLSR
jgi:hypothetical protein